MTIAISLKVHDGLVLAADSASTLVGQSPNGPVAINVYNHANKVFNLKKGLPIGAITWGSGSIGNASISTLMKDLRRRFDGDDPEHIDWKIDPANYQVAAVAELVREFFFTELYTAAFEGWPEKPDLGFMVCGYSADAPLAEEYLITEATDAGPLQAVRQLEECGLTWNGQPEAIGRLVHGFSANLGNVLHMVLGVPEEQIEPAIEALRAHLVAPFIQPAMPLQDAIDLARFLVDLTVQYTRFDDGAPSVGGPIELAAVSKHEGFKWIARKHYYSPALNPVHEATQPGAQ